MTTRGPRRRSYSRGAAPAVGTPEPPSTGELTTGPDDKRLAYSVDEAARLTGLSRDLLYDQMRQGNLVYIKVGRRRLITRQHLERFLDIAPRPAIYEAGRTGS